MLNPKTTVSDSVETVVFLTLSTVTWRDFFGTMESVRNLVFHVAQAKTRFLWSTKGP